MYRRRLCSSMASRLDGLRDSNQLSKYRRIGRGRLIADMIQQVGDQVVGGSAMLFRRAQAVFGDRAKHGLYISGLGVITTIHQRPGPARLQHGKAGTRRNSVNEKPGITRRLD